MENDKIGELIEKIAGNDENALDELYTLTKQHYYYVAREYLIEKFYAEDVLSVAYLKLYKKSHLYNRKLNGFNWMFEIVKNTAIDFNRNNTKDGVHKILDDEDLNRIPSEEFNGIEIRKVQLALRVLSDKEYTIIYLRIWENKTIKFIAEMLGFNVARVYKTYNDALAKLRKELE
ncbi:MAG: sigma-70 family RNA polymerase sigma factor [Anaeroplasmataceae bacterium]|nr:sigma-70 family RNA polymerase sigma factor [Anaeroplasmataceae bacterium]